MTRQPTPAVSIELNQLEEGQNELTLDVSAAALELE